MYAVIFRAEINEIDDSYITTAARMRKLAIKDYGCIELTSTTEGTQEITVSYWESLEDIKQWKENPEHKAAQELGRTKWYKWYKVQIVNIVREYKSSA